MTDAELDQRIAETLGIAGVSTASLDKARMFQRTRGSSLAGAVHELHLSPDEVLNGALQELTGARSVDPRLLTVYPDFVESVHQLIPREIAASMLVFPAQIDANAIHVCMVNPTDGWTARSLESLSGCRVVPFVANEVAIQSALERHYGVFKTGQPTRAGQRSSAEAEVVYRLRLAEPIEQLVRPAEALINRTRDAIARDPKALATVIREPAIIRLVHQIIVRAVEAGASDIHVEPLADLLRIRTRVDGRVRVFAELPPGAARVVVARLKSMADLPIEPAKEPLDGRIGYDLTWNRPIDLRFSLVPAVTGENVVMRVLDRSRERKDLTDLGLDAHTLRLVREAAELPNGLLLVTGPTGSGKTSTLYALLDTLNASDTCVLTAEDPVESNIKGVTQVQCSEESGVGFAAALRSFLRQDPDVIMVGEIRDVETAETALKAALTGHLVLSTLHTNDASGAVLRLLNMNIEPFIIASALRIVIAQRLIRRLCTECRKPAPPERVQNWLSSLDATLAAQLLEVRANEAAGNDTWPSRLDARTAEQLGAVTVFEAAGCDRCGQTGYKGRTGIFEVLWMTDALEGLALARASAADLRKQARREGMRSLRDAGWMKVVAGETTIEEVLENTLGESIGAAP
jgi:type IV pilus assembly protein PilB